MVQDLRTINLMEADFNFNNKVLAKITIEYAEKNNLLPLEKFRSRKAYCVIF